MVYFYNTPYEIQRQELVFDNIGNTLIAQVEMNCNFIENGVLPPPD